MTQNVKMSPEDEKAYNEAVQQAEYYDRLQYCMKIKLNSLYGALLNNHFRFHDARNGASTTAIGRCVVQHQARKVNEFLGGEYNVAFPLYENVKEAVESGRVADTALNGPVFKGSFQSKSVIGGDTDSVYFLTGAKNKEEAIKIADASAEYVNKSYPEFMRETFLCTPGFDDKIKCGREIVSDRGIFVEKKRYILHLVDVEGKSVDKMKVMGLDIKKTTIPKHVSEEIEKFIEQLLKGKDWSVLSREIVKYKETLRTSDNVLDIGLPKGCNGVEDYTKQLQLHGDKARVPGHVRAAIYWNKMLDMYGDLSSPRIMSGTKIKVYYLKRYSGKDKSIAIPTDIEQVPEWFVQYVQPNIDYDAQMQRLVDNPLENILKAIDQTSPTAQTLWIEEQVEF